MDEFFFSFRWYQSAHLSHHWKLQTWCSCCSRASLIVAFLSKNMIFSLWYSAYQWKLSEKSWTISRLEISLLSHSITLWYQIRSSDLDSRLWTSFPSVIFHPMRYLPRYLELPKRGDLAFIPPAPHPSQNTEQYTVHLVKRQKLEEPVNRKLNVTRSWNFIYILYLA